MSFEANAEHLKYLTHRFLQPEALNVSAATKKLTQAISIKKCLSLFHVNTRSLNANFENFSYLIDTLSLPFSILGISELWCNETKDFSPFKIKGYEFIPQPRKQKGGGVGAYILSNLQYKMRDDLNIEECDNIWIEVKDKNKHHLICIMYHSPDKQDTSTFQESLGKTLSEINKNKYDVTLMGDTNINLFNIDPSSEYIQNMLMNGLKSLMIYPTRKTENTETLIDHIFTSNIFLHMLLEE
eukprot:Lithocolla_globosa_v1_NODE_337_length_4409_cov_50.992421.p2 type:complete len:241 gc:universal NODE_337_length_4409_cov_50.992421:4052-3330(-)